MTNIQLPLSYRRTPFSADWWEIRNPFGSRGLEDLPELYLKKGQVPCVQQFLWKYFWSVGCSAKVTFVLQLRVVGCRCPLRSIPLWPSVSHCCWPAGWEAWMATGRLVNWAVQSWQNKWECATLVHSCPLAPTESILQVSLVWCSDLQEGWGSGNTAAAWAFSQVKGTELVERRRELG